jgi:hypothetical protein
MSNDVIEARLASWYHEVDAESASSALRAAIAAIPDTSSASRIGRRAGPRRWPLLLVAAAVSVALVGATIAYVGSQVRTAVTPTPVPSSAPSSLPTLAPSAGPPGTTLSSGVTETPIGRLSWTRLEGDASTIPAGEILRAADGSLFAIESPSTPGGLPLDGARLWRGVDGAWIDLDEPLPAVGRVSGEVVDGELLLWDQGYSLWRGEALDHVDLSDLKPEPIAGVEWRNTIVSALATDAGMIIAWGVRGAIQYDDLLGFTTEPGESLRVGDDPEHTSPTLGEVRPVYGSRHRLVGRLRAELRGPTTAALVEVDSQRVLLEIDARTLGLTDISDLWRAFYLGFIPGPNAGAILAGDEVRAFTPPTTLRVLHGPAPTYGTIGSTLIEFAQTEDVPDDPPFPSGSTRRQVEVRTSTDGRTWTEQPRARIGGDLLFGVDLLPNLSDGTAGRLVAQVSTELAPTKVIIAASVDGSDWEPVFATPDIGRGEFEASLAARLGGRGYVALMFPDLVVSPDGRDWTVVAGPPDIGAVIDMAGGSLGPMYALGPDTVSFQEISEPRRVTWTLTFDPS